MGWIGLDCKARVCARGRDLGNGLFTGMWPAPEMQVHGDSPPPMPGGAGDTYHPVVVIEFPMHTLGTVAMVRGNVHGQSSIGVGDVENLTRILVDTAGYLGVLVMRY